MEDLANKATTDSQKCVDDITVFKEQLKQLQDERKRDVEETAEFINQLVTQNKHDHEKETSQIFEQMDEMRRDLAHRVGASELNETRSNLAGVLDTKVDLSEV